MKNLREREVKAKIRLSNRVHTWNILITEGVTGCKIKLGCSWSLISVVPLF